MNSEETKATPIGEDAGIPKKVKDALSDPLTLAQIAASLDPGAILAGRTSAPLERAAILLLDAGELCARLSSKALSELRIALGNREADYQAVVTSALKTDAGEHPYSPPAQPAAELILSEDQTRDTLRPFLAEHANFEGKQTKRKRGAWKTTRMVKTNLRRWFIARANDENIAKAKESGRVPQGEEWRDGGANFNSAMVDWNKGSAWHIPRDEFLKIGIESMPVVSPTSWLGDRSEFQVGKRSEDLGAAAAPGTALGPGSHVLPEAEWRFIPWYRRAKETGDLKSFDCQMAAEEVLRAVNLLTAASKRAVKKKQSEESRKAGRRKAKFGPK